METLENIIVVSKTRTKPSVENNREEEEWKPETITFLLDTLGLPVYDLMTTQHLIEDILTWYQSNSPDNLTEEEIQEYGDRLATISDAELCSTWYLTVGEHALSEMDFTNDETKDMRLYREYYAIIAEREHGPSEQALFDTSRIDELRREKGEVMERINAILMPYYYQPNDIGKLLVEFMDTSTICVILQRLRHFGGESLGLIPSIEASAKEYYMPGKSVRLIFKRMMYYEGYTEIMKALRRTHYRLQRAADWRWEDYSRFADKNIYGTLDIKRHDTLFAYLPLENLKKFLDAVKIKYKA
jgi:hypothetical protein